MSRPEITAGTGANDPAPVPAGHLRAVVSRVLDAFLRPLREEVPCCHKARP